MKNDLFHAPPFLQFEINSNNNPNKKIIFYNFLAICEKKETHKNTPKLIKKKLY